MNGRKKPCKICGIPVFYYNKTGMCLACVNERRRKDYVSKWLQNSITTKGKPSKWIRDYLLNDQNYKCHICGVSGNWNGHPLIFILDHINGDSAENKRGNLRMVCPNCDSQLPTYKNKNRGSGRKYYRDAGNLRYERKRGRVDNSIALEKQQV